MATVFRAPLIFRTWQNGQWVTSVHSQAYVWEERNTGLLLGKDILPENQSDWPNPVWPTPRLVAAHSQAWIVSDRNANLLVGKDTFFRTAGYGPNYDYPNPTLPKSRLVAQSAQSWLEADRLNNLLKGKDQFFWGGPPDYDYPNPTLPKSRVVSNNTYMDERPDRLLDLLVGKDTLPDNQKDWPNPNRIKYSWGAALYAQDYVFRDGILTTLVGQDQLPENQFDWPNPIRLKDAQGPARGAEDGVRQDWLLGVLQGQDAIYGTQGQVPDYDWPNPNRLKNERGVATSAQDGVWQDRLTTVLLGKDILPENQSDWPVFPAIRPKSSYAALTAQSNVFMNIAVLLVAATPLFSVDQPNPVVRKAPTSAVIAAQDSVWSNRLTNLLIGQDLLPENQLDWPNPTLRLKPPLSVLKAQDDVWQDRLNTVLLGQDQLPENQFDWPDPTLPKSRLVSVLAYSGQPSILGVLVGKDQLPEQQFDWPNPRILKEPYGAALRAEDGVWRDTLLTTLLGQDVLPFSQDNWSNPNLLRRAVAQDIPGVNLLLFGTTTTSPFAQTDWPNPPARAKPAPKHEWTILPILLGQDRMYGAPGQVPTFSFDNPPRARRIEHQDILRNLLLLSAVQAPFAQNDWPNPILSLQKLVQQPGGQNWLANFLAGQPLTALDWALPRTPASRIAARAQYEVFRDLNTLYGADLLPENQKDWPNPTVPKSRKAAVEAQDAVFYNAALFNFGGSSPFHQINWPNPVLAISRDAALRAEAEVWQDGLLTILQGQDQFFGGPGRGPVYDYPNPTLTKGAWTAAVFSQTFVWQSTVQNAEVLIARDHLLGSETKPELLGSETPTNLLGSKLRVILKGKLDT